MRGYHPIYLLPALLILFFMMGCLGMKISLPAMATIPGISGHFRVGQIVDLHSGKVLSFEQLIEQITSKDLIFVGEVHDNPEHHLIQVQVLQALLGCCSPLSVAMEFFQKPEQEFLDRYLRGELTESEFLREVNWKGDYHFYRPLMLLAKQNGSKVLAINAPNPIVKKVARHGLKGLDEIERTMVAKDIDLKNEAHRAYVRKAYKQPHHSKLKSFDYFYEAHCVWEETMAHNLSEYLKENKTKLIVFTGNGHIIHKFGIPDRTFRRLPVSMVTIMPFPIQEKVSIEKASADYVWLTARYPHRFNMF